MWSVIRSVVWSMIRPMIWSVIQSGPIQVLSTPDFTWSYCHAKFLSESWPPSSSHFGAQFCTPWRSASSFLPLAMALPRHYPHLFWRTPNPKKLSNQQLCTIYSISLHILPKRACTTSSPLFWSLLLVNTARVLNISGDPLPRAKNVTPLGLHYSQGN